MTAPAVPAANRRLASLKRLTFADVVLWGLRAVVVVVGGTIGTLVKGTYTTAQWVDFFMFGLTIGGVYVLMGMGLNLELGLAGLLDLGFVAFFAVGAYTTALLTSNADIAIANMSFRQALPIAVVLSVIVGVLFGIPVLKVRGDYLAVATLGFGEIVRVLVLSDFAAPVLGGAQGVLGIPRPQIAGFEFDDPIDLFYITLVASAVAAYFAWRLKNSRLGRAWTAIRDDEDVAQALGINLVNVKLLAYGLGAGFAGVAGSTFAVMLASIFPHSFQLLISINVLALLIVGGMGSLPGVVVGAAALIGLPELLREFGEYRFLFYGLVIVVMMRLKAEGLWPSAAKRREKRLEEESQAAIEAELRGGGCGEGSAMTAPGGLAREYPPEACSPRWEGVPLGARASRPQRAEGPRCVQAGETPAHPGKAALQGAPRRTWRGVPRAPIDHDRRSDPRLQRPHQALRGAGRGRSPRPLGLGGRHP